MKNQEKLQYVNEVVEDILNELQANGIAHLDVTFDKCKETIDCVVDNLELDVTQDDVNSMSHLLFSILSSIFS